MSAGGAGLAPPAVAAHGDAVQSFGLVFDAAVDWTRFGLWLTMLLNRHGGAILRVKGLLNVDGSDTPVAIHGVQHSLHPPVHLNDWPGDLQQSQLVFILRGVSATRLKQAFLRFQQPFLTGDTAP